MAKTRKEQREEEKALKLELDNAHQELLEKQLNIAILYKKLEDVRRTLPKKKKVYATESERYKDYLKSEKARKIEEMKLDKVAKLLLGDDYIDRYSINRKQNRNNWGR